MLVKPNMTIEPLSPSEVLKEPLTRRIEVKLCALGNAALSQSLNGQIALITRECTENGDVRWRHQKRFKPTEDAENPGCWTIQDVRRGLSILRRAMGAG